MSTLRITNVSPSTLWLRDLYTELSPGETATITRTPAEMGDMIGLQGFITEGLVSVDIDLDPHEAPSELVAVWPLGLNWRPTVQTLVDLNALPVAKNREGDVRIVVDTLTLFGWDGTAWQPLDGGAGIASITGVAPISITAGANPIVSHNASGVVAGTYGDASNSARLTVDAKGHVSAATQVPISITAPIGTFVLGTGPIQTISANTDQITPVAPLHRIQMNGTNKALTSTPQINLPGAVLGQVLIIQNVDPANHVDLARGVAEKLSLSNANKRIDPGGSMMLVFNGTVWVEVSHTGGTST